MTVGLLGLDLMDHLMEPEAPVDVITACKVLDAVAKEVSQKDIQQAMQSGYGIFGGEAKNWAKLKFTPERARWVQAEEWHPEQKTTLHSVYVSSYRMARTDWQFSQRTGNVGIVADYSTFAIHGYRDNSDTRRQQVNTVVTVDAKLDTRIKLIANIFDMPYAKDPLGLTASQYATNPGQAGNYAIVNGTQKTIG